MQIIKAFPFNECLPSFADGAVAGVVRLPVGAKIPGGTVLGSVNAPARNEVRTVTITGSPTGGTFTLTFAADQTYTTGALAYNVAAADFQSALEGIFGKGNVAVTGPSSGVYTLTFQNALGNARIGTGFAVAAAFTGGTSPAVSTTATTRGCAGPGQADAYASGNSDGTQVPTCILRRDYTSDAQGGRATEWFDTNSPTEAGVWKGGFFRVGSVAGFDATCVSSGWAKYTLGTDPTNANTEFKI